jgi:hypothetical protein
MMLYAQPLWIHDPAVAAGLAVYLYGAGRLWRRLLWWERAAYVAGGVFLGYYEAASGMGWEWAALGFSALAAAVGRVAVRDARVQDGA